MENQSGVSMVQVVISAGLAGAVALGLVKLQENAQRSQNTIMKNYETLQIITAAENTLRDKKSCMATFTAAGGNVADDIQRIIRSTDLGDTDIIEVDKEYAGQGQGSKIVVKSIGFQKDSDGNPQFTGRTLIPSTGNFSASIDLNIVIDKSNNDSRDGVKAYGAQEITRKMRDFRLIVTPANDIVNCFSPEDEYVIAACTSLGGDINATTGKCDNLNVNNITTAEFVSAGTNLIAQNQINLNNCLSIGRGNGPGSEPGVFYRTNGGCEKNFLQGSMGKDSAMGDFGIEGHFYSKIGTIIFGEGLPPGTGGGNFARILRSGNDLEYRMSAGNRHHFTNANVEVQRQFRVKQLSFLEGNTEITGNLDVSGRIDANTVVTPSDERFKENFESLDRSLEKLLKVGTYSFDWIDENKDQNRQIGFKAQELQKYFPEMIHANEEGYLFVNYQAMVVPVVHAIQEQQKKIDSLEKELKEIKALLKK